jgi:hypothetical protein
MYTIAEFAERLRELESIGSRSIAIGTADAQAGAVARALEFGSIAGQRPWPHSGPKTTVAIDVETGAQVVVSVQAPQGFIRIRRSRFLESLRQALAGAPDWLDVGEVNAHLEARLRETAEQILAELRPAVPKDSGRLAQSLTISSDVAVVGR